MALGNLRNRYSDEDTDVNMIPIMNIFLVIIPFLLTSVSFFHIKAINTSVPVMASGENSPSQVAETVKVTVIVQLKKNGMHLSATADELNPSELGKLDHLIRRDGGGRYPLSELNQYLQTTKSTYPASDTLILIPDSQVIYDTIIQAMDAARKIEDQPLFPNVVLSGSLG